MDMLMPKNDKTKEAGNENIKADINENEEKKGKASSPLEIDIPQGSDNDEYSEIIDID